MHGPGPARTRRILVGLVSLAVFLSSGAVEARPAEAKPSKSRAASKEGVKRKPQEIRSLRTRDSKTYLNPDRTLRTVFGHRLHYEAAPGRFEKVDLRFRPAGEGYIADRGDVVMRIDGDAESASLDAANRATGAGIRWLLPRRPTVSGTTASFRDQGLDWEYAHGPDGVKLGITVAKERGRRTYRFRYELLGGADPLEVDARGNLVSGAFRTPRAFAVGANGARRLAGPWRLDGTDAVAFDFDDGDLPKTAYPYVIDPTTTFTLGGSRDDGVVSRWGSEYPPAGPITVETADILRANRTECTGASCASFQSSGYEIALSMMRFDTSSLPDHAVVTDATLHLSFEHLRTLAYAQPHDSDGLDLRMDWYRSWPIDAADYTEAALPGTALSAPVLPAPSDGAYALQDPAAGVSLTGYTGLRAGLSGSGAPVGYNQLGWDSFEYSYSGPPRLEVIYTVPTTTPLLLSADLAENPVLEGDEVGFELAFSAPGQDVRAVICKTNQVSSNGTCPKGAWAAGSPTSSSPAVASFESDASDVGPHAFYAFACNTSGECSVGVPGAFLVSSRAFQTPARVQAATASNFWASPPTRRVDVSWPQPTGPGNLLVLGVSAAWIDGAGTISVPLGWTLARTQTQSGVVTTLYVWEGAPPQASPVSVQTSADAVIGASLAEYRGILAQGSLDAAASESGVGTAAASGTTAQTAQPVELWLGVIAAALFDPEEPTDPLNRTITYQENPTGGFAAATGYPGVHSLYEKVAPAAGEAGVSVTLSRDAGWAGVVQTFRTIPRLIIASFGASPDPFSPDGDDLIDETIFTADIDSDATLVTWKLTVKNSSGEVIREYTGSGEDVTQAWDGADALLRTQPDGTYTARLQAKDNLGNEDSRSATVDIDTTSPPACPPGTRSERLFARTSIAKVFCETDGTLTAEIHAAPIHYQDAEGAWREIDNTLEPATGGGFRNGANSFTATFAATTPTDPLVRLSEGALKIAATPQNAANAVGVVDGSRITYKDVYPGVDLVYTSRAEGVKEELILKQAPTSAVSFAFQMSLDGLTAQTESDGFVSYLDSGGEMRYVTPNAWMTDSATDPTSGEGATSDDVTLSLSGSASAPTLTVTPDLGWLQEAARVYPVMIDPSWAKTPSLDTFVQNDYSSAQYASEDLKAGSYNSGSTKARSLLKFDVSGLTGKHILSATLKLYEYWSSSCTARKLNLYRVNSNWSSSVTWSNQPSTGAFIDDVNVAKGYSSSCPADWISLSATSLVANWASGDWPNYGLKLQADDESDSLSWKRFRSSETSSDPQLSVSYNSYPNVPDTLSPSGGTIAPGPATLKGRFYDRDGGNGYVAFEVRKKSDNSLVASSGNKGPVASNTVVSWTPTLTSGIRYTWRARAYDGTDYSNWTAARDLTIDAAPTTTLDTPTHTARVPTVLPVLKAAATDADAAQGDGPVAYQFQVADNSAFTGATSSGWLPQTANFTVPPGVFEDGKTYYWRAQAKDSFGQAGAFTSARSFDVRVPKLGQGSAWPMWSHGPVSVNQATGNLVLQAPAPSYPTLAGSLSATLSYNSLDTADSGLGAGWRLAAGPDPDGTPARLVDHAASGATPKMDAAELVFGEGWSDFFTRVGTTDTYQAPPESGDQLKRNADGTWTYIQEAGTVYTFGTADPVSGVANLTSAELTEATKGTAKLAYTFAGAPLRIAKIKDEATGLEMTFDWACAGARLCITGPDSVTWRYEGTSGATGPLAVVNNGTRDVVKFSYDTASPSRIVNVQNANDLNPSAASPGYDGAHAITISYESSGVVVAATEGPVSGQSPASAKWSFDYRPGTTTTPTGRAADGYTVLTPPRQQGLSESPRV